jgi:DNA repair protein RadC
MRKEKETRQIREVQLSYSSNRENLLKDPISSSKSAYEYLIKAFNENTIGLQEEFIALLLNRANKPIGAIKLHKGGLDSTIVDVRLLMAAALKSATQGIILAHNHPSGELKPSQADRNLTTKIKDACKILNIALLDHVIVSPFGNYMSFADDGLI